MSSESQRTGGIPHSIRANGGGHGSENDALLQTNGNGASVHVHAPSTSILKSNLKSNLNYGGVSKSPKPVSSPGRRPARRKDRGASFSQLSQSATSMRSYGSMFSHGGQSRFAAETSTSAILAPEEFNLPPDTPLYGSSKLAANAYHQEHQESVKGLRDDESDTSSLGTMGTARTARTLQEIEADMLAKTRTSFVHDAMTFAEGTIPQSIVMALVIGIVCGVVAYVYYFVLDYFLELIWKDLPELWVVDRWPEEFHWLWIPLVSTIMSICCGLSVYFLGEPGDLAYTIQCVHEKGYKGTSHIVPMVAASLFSILAGASLGPEAPLVAICAATAGFVSRKGFKQTNRNVVRKHTFMGMSGALAAFFGAPLGGSLFALEVTSRFGIEYFEHLIEAIFAGEVCVTVFRSLAGMPLMQIWEIAPVKMTETEPYMILLGAAIGLLGAGVSFIWANFHWRLMGAFRDLGLLDDENENAVPRVLVGACGVVALGVLVPQTMFWGEFEFGTIATLEPASDLPHIWPTAGLIGFEMDSLQNCLIVGFCKLLAISFTVAGGYRGGYIFPFFSAGAAFGRALCFAFPNLSPVIATLCFAAGINVAITRTALATSLILSFLAGEQFALPAVLAASVVSLFATGYVPFIKSQLARSDIDFSLYYKKNRRTGPAIQETTRNVPGSQPLSIDDLVVH